MSIDFPTYQQTIDRNRSDVSALLPQLDPTIFGTFVRGFTDSQAGRSFDITILQEQLLDQMFPQTATGDFLLRWAGYENLTRLPATEAEGNVTATGTALKVIPSGTNLSSADGNIYITQSEVTLTAEVIAVTSITRSGVTATVTTTSSNELATGQNVTIAGAVETDYNGTFAITVLSETEFTYQVSGSPTTPATGTITAAYTGATVAVKSQDTQDTANGVDLNIDSGGKLSLTSPISGVDATAYVQFSGVSGATDEESDESLRSRTDQSRANPVANFNPASIEKLVLQIAGVTRVLVKRITPYVGAVTILFVRDNDDNIIPDAGEVAEVDAAVLLVLPAQSDPADLFVKAPTAVTVPFTFTSITPDTSTMRSAIGDSLSAFFEDEVTFETDIDEDKYRAAIINTVDLETGEELETFTLSTPTGDVTVTTDEIGVLGAVTF